jgi:hypothetical protein
VETPENGVPTSLGNPAHHAGFPLFHSSDDCEIFTRELFSLDDGDQFSKNATTSVASLRGLIGSIPER